MDENRYTRAILSDDSRNYNKIYNLILNNNLSEAKLMLQEMHYADFVDFFDQSPPKLHRKILILVSNDLKKQSLVLLSYDSRMSIINILGQKRIANLLEGLETQDIIGFMEDLDDDVVRQILVYLSLDKQKYVIEGLTYHENSAGRIMEKQYISLPEHWTIKQSIGYIRSYDVNKDFYVAVIVDNKHRPVGNLPLFRLLRFDYDMILSSIMSTNIQVETHTDLNEVSYIFRHYSLTMVPVVSKIGKLVGIISINQILHILDEQVEEDIMYLAGVQKYSMFTNLFRAARHRLPWLFFNLITALLTSRMIAAFEDVIARFALIASVMPVVASMGGNTGTQVMTITVRSLSNKYINFSNFFTFLIKEILICGSNGILLSMFGFVLTMLMYDNLYLSIAFGFTVILNFIIAGILGFIIPTTLNSINVDPAAGSGVLLTALTDCIGFFTLLYIAYVFLV